MQEAQTFIRKARMLFVELIGSRTGLVMTKSSRLAQERVLGAFLPTGCATSCPISNKVALDRASLLPGFAGKEHGSHAVRMDKQASRCDPRRVLFHPTYTAASGW